MKALTPPQGFTFGCDPELFIFDDKRNKPVPAVNIIPGTKEKPHRVPDGAVQVDGMAAEFNIDPAKTFEEFKHNINSVMKTLQSYLPSGYSLQLFPAVYFGKIDFDAVPDENKMLGCSPDFDAWTGKVNPPPNMVNNPYLRTAAGHIHCGWTDEADMSDIQHILNCRDLVKQFDWYLGAWSLLHDPDHTRRSLYGKAGAYRPKPYGVEYRVLSNFWLKSSELMQETWNRAVKAVIDMKEYYVPDHFRKNSQLIAAINSGNLLTLGNVHFPVFSYDSESEAATSKKRVYKSKDPFLAATAPPTFATMTAADGWAGGVQWQEIHHTTGIQNNG